MNSKNFQSAHKHANMLEKKKYPKGYQKLEKIDKSLPPDEILGHINKSGNITVSKKVPKNLRGEVCYHEKIERKRILGRRKGNR